MSYYGSNGEQDKGDGKCVCPPGFKGDGVKSCVGKRTKNLVLPTAAEYYVIGHWFY